MPNIVTCAVYPVKSRARQPTDVAISGVDIGSRHQVKLEGDLRCASLRAKKVLSMQRATDGSWPAIFAQPPAGDQVQIHVDADKSRKQILQ